MFSGTGGRGAPRSMTGAGIYCPRGPFMEATPPASPRGRPARTTAPTRTSGRAPAVPSPTITALLALGARDVLAGLRVDPDHVPCTDEVRHRHHQAGLGGGGLEDVGDGRALEPGGGLDDLQIDRLRKAHAHRFPLVELDLDTGIGGQELDRVAENVRLERHLLEVLGVHEVVLPVALVAVLNLLLLEGHALRLVLGAEAVFGLRPAAQLPQF